MIWQGKAWKKHGTAGRGMAGLGTARVNHQQREGNGR